MEKGNLVRVTDGSYSMLSDNNGGPRPTNGRVLIAEGDWKILEVGKFPKFTDNKIVDRWGGEREVNNVQLQSVKCPSRVCWTQLCFCHSV